MMKKTLLVFMLLVATATLYTGSLYALNPLSNRVCIDSSKTPNVDVKSIDGRLIISSDTKMIRVDVFSVIGGLLYSSKVDFTDVTIEGNFPKTLLIVRVVLENHRSMIYKVINR